MSKKSSTFVQLLRGANGELTPQAKSRAEALHLIQKRKPTKAGEQDAESIRHQAKSTKDDPRQYRRCEV